jgi:hypothetical protein
MRWIRTLLAAVVLVLPACGGDDEPRAASPRLEPRVAAPLATQADRVAAALERGDPCTARREATELQRRTVGAVNTGDVPAALQEELTAAVNRVAAEVVCVPPAAAPVAAVRPHAAPSRARPGRGHAAKKAKAPKHHGKKPGKGKRH